MMNEYWIGFEAGLAYSKRVADAKRSDAELKALLAAKKDRAEKLATAQAAAWAQYVHQAAARAHAPQEEPLDRAEKLAKAQALVDAHVKRCQGWDPAEKLAKHERVFSDGGFTFVPAGRRIVRVWGHDGQAYLPPVPASLSHWGMH